MSRHSAALCGLLCMAALGVGCSSTRLMEAERPASAPTVEPAPPDLEVELEAIEVAPPGAPTEPIGRTLIQDTTTAPTIQLEAARVNRARQEMWFRFRVGEKTVEETYRLPAVGETWWLTLDSLRADPDTSAPDTVETAARVEGAPRPDTVTVRAPSPEPTWWEKRLEELRMVLAVAFGFGVGYVFARIFR